MKYVDKVIIEELLKKAADNPRRRAHHNLHTSPEDPIQRLCVGACIGTYIRPHRHAEPHKWELFIVLQGTAAMLIFDQTGVVTERIDLVPGMQSTLAEVPPRVWHTLVVTSPAAVLVEIKPGPYLPLPEMDFASWSPPEHSQSAQAFELRMREAGCGCRMEY